MIDEKAEQMEVLLSGKKRHRPGETVLHWACEKGNLKIVKKILESENWNLREKMEVLNMVCPEKGLAPLQLARKNEHVEVGNVSFSLFTPNYQNPRDLCFYFSSFRTVY